MSKSDSYTDAYFYLQNIREHVKDLFKKKRKKKKKDYQQLTENNVIENISRFRIQQSTHKTLNCMVFPYHTITQSFKKLSINSKIKFVVRLFSHIIKGFNNNLCNLHVLVHHWICGFSLREREVGGEKKFQQLASKKVVHLQMEKECFFHNLRLNLNDFK